MKTQGFKKLVTLRTGNTEIFAWLLVRNPGERARYKLQCRPLGHTTVCALTFHWGGGGVGWGGVGWGGGGVATKQHCKHFAKD